MAWPAAAAAALAAAAAALLSLLTMILLYLQTRKGAMLSFSHPKATTNVRTAEPGTWKYSLVYPQIFQLDVQQVVTRPESIMFLIPPMTPPPLLCQLFFHYAT